MEPADARLNNRISQLLGAAFIVGVAFTIVSLRCSGWWHEVAVSIVAGIVTLLFATFVAEILVKKYNEEKYNPVRNYAYSVLQKAITDAFLRLIPPGIKSPLNIADFDRYTATYYDIEGIHTSLRSYYMDMFRNSAEEEGSYEKCIVLFQKPIDELMLDLRKIRHDFFSILDLNVLEAILLADNEYAVLEEDGKFPGVGRILTPLLYAEVCLLIINKAYELQRLLLLNARCISFEEHQQQVKVKTEDAIKRVAEELNISL